MADTSYYQKAYKVAQTELRQLLLQQEEIENSIVVLRQTVNTLAEFCKDKKIKIDPSRDAERLLENSSLPDEIVTILRSEYHSEYHEWLRPSDIKIRLMKLGHNMDKYSNPLATIHMVVKRLKEAKRVRERIHPQGFKVYQCQPISVHNGSVKEKG